MNNHYRIVSYSVCPWLASPGVDLIKLFWRKFTYFCKLGHSIAMQQKLLML
jgi:hypothetical protein